MKASADNLRRIAGALTQYHNSRGRFPPQSVETDSQEPGLSWRVAVLPYLGEQELYDKFNLSEPWDGEANRALLDEMPDFYRSPRNNARPGFTNYLGVEGGKTLFRGAKALRKSQVLDGTSRTIFIVEVEDAAAVEWTRPTDYTCRPDAPSLFLGAGEESNEFLCTLVDGSVQRLAKDLDQLTLMALFTADGGEHIDGLEDLLPPSKKVEEPNKVENPYAGYPDRSPHRRADSAP